MKALAAGETWTYWWIVKWSGPQPLASIWVWSWDPLRFVRRHLPHHLSPAEQTTRQGVILWGASAAPQPAQERSNQGRKPVISAQTVAGRAKILPAVSNPTLSAKECNISLFLLNNQSASIHRPNLCPNSGS